MALHVGDMYRTIGTFRNEDGELANPTNVVLEVMNPPGEIVAPNPVEFGHPSIGIYEYDVVLDYAGVYEVKWFGQGQVTAAEPAQIYVTRDNLGAAL